MSWPAPTRAQSDQLIRYPAAPCYGTVLGQCPSSHSRASREDNPRQRRRRVALLDPAASVSGKRGSPGELGATSMRLAGGREAGGTVHDDGRRASTSGTSKRAVQPKHLIVLANGDDPSKAERHQAQGLVIAPSPIFHDSTIHVLHACPISHAAPAQDLHACLLAQMHGAVPHTATSVLDQCHAQACFLRPSTGTACRPSSLHG